MCAPVLWQPCRAHSRSPARLTTGPAQTLSVRYFKPEEALELPVHEELAAPGRSYSPGDHTLPWREADFTFSPGRDNSSNTHGDPNPRLPSFYTNVYETIRGDAQPVVKMEETRELMRVLEECRTQAMGPERNRRGTVGAVGGAKL